MQNDAERRRRGTTKIAPSRISHPTSSTDRRIHPGGLACLLCSYRNNARRASFIEHSFVIGFHLLWVAGSFPRPSNVSIVTGSEQGVVLVPGGPSSPNAPRCGLLKSHTWVFPGLCHSDLDGFGDGDVRVLADQVHLRPRVAVKAKLAEIWALGLFCTKIILRLPGLKLLDA